MKNNNEYSFEIIDALYLRNLRKIHGDSAQDICNKINVSKSFLYYVETGTKRLSEDILNNVLMIYDEKYDRSIELYDYGYNFTVKVFESFVFKNETLKKELEKEFLEKKEELEKSRAFVFVDLIVAILKLLDKPSITRVSLEKSNNYLDIYDNNIAGIYSIIYAFAHGVFKNLEETSKVILKVKDKYDISRMKKCIKGMYIYQLGRISFEKKEFFDTMRYYKDAIDIFHDIYCVERAIQAKIEYASTLLYLKMFDKAEVEYLRLVQESIMYNYSRRICSCYNNLAFLYYFKNEYEKCEMMIYKAKDAGSTHPDINYYLAYCAYKTKSKDEAKKIISKLLDKETDKYAQHMINLIHGFLNNNDKKTEKYFLLAEKDILAVNDSIDLIKLYEMNIDYYRDINVDKYKCFVDKYIKLINS